MGSDSVSQPTVGAAIQACYTEDKLTESMMTKSLSEFHTITTMIRLHATRPANQGLIPLRNSPMQQSTPSSSPQTMVRIPLLAHQTMSNGF